MRCCTRTVPEPRQSGHTSAVVPWAQPVPRQEPVGELGGAQNQLHGLAGGEGPGGIKALPVPGGKDPVRQFHAAAVGEDVAEADHRVGVLPVTEKEQLHLAVPGDGEGLLQGGRGVAEVVLPPLLLGVVLRHLQLVLAHVDDVMGRVHGVIEAEDIPALCRGRLQENAVPGAGAGILAVGPKGKPPLGRGPDTGGVPPLLPGGVVFHRRALLHPVFLSPQKPLQPPEVEQVQVEPQGVLPKAPGGFPHTAQRFSLQVLPAPHGVKKSPPGVPGHGVDGEIPPGKVCLHLPDKGHPVRMPVVGIGPVGAVGGHLPVFPLQPDGKGAVAQAGGDYLPAGKDRLHLLRPGGGAKVPVLGRKAQETIPDAAPHRPGLVSRPFQPLQNRGGRRRHGDFPHSPAPPRTVVFNRRQHFTALYHEAKRNGIIGGFAGCPRRGRGERPLDKRIMAACGHYTVFCFQSKQGSPKHLAFCYKE